MTQPIYNEVGYAGTDSERHAAWLEQRTHGIGGSDAGACMGMNPWKTPLALWLEKTGREEPQDVSDKPAVEWGTRLESEIRAKFAENHPELTVCKPDATYISRERPWAIANLDGVLIDKDGRRGVLEIKTAGHYSEKDWADGVPMHYQAQVCHYLGVTGWAFAYVAVLIAGQEYREYFIERDETDVQAVADAVDEFWNKYVLMDIMPSLMGVRDEKASLAVAHADKSEEMKQARDADLPLDELEDVREKIKELEKRRDALEVRIMAFIGDYKGVMTDTRRVTWVRSNRRTFKSKEFAKKYPDLYEQYTVEVKGNGGLRISERRD